MLPMTAFAVRGLGAPVRGSQCVSSIPALLRSIIHGSDIDDFQNDLGE